MIEKLTPETLRAFADESLMPGSWNVAVVTTHADAWQADVRESDARFRLSKEHAARIVKLQAEVEALRRIDDLARRAVAAKGLSDMSGESEMWEDAWDALRAALAAAACWWGLPRTACARSAVRRGRG